MMATSQAVVPASAQEAEGSEAAASSKLIGAGMAFGLAALGAGIGLDLHHIRDLAVV
jgi:F0F1-type ATP synthase membrane subunit c/vacuolar-type H+-ATPase subunit K